MGIDTHRRCGCGHRTVAALLCGGGLEADPENARDAALGPDIPVNYVEADGAKLRYIKTGAGPVVVLPHTLRTQLDLFEKVVPELSKRFSVYAVDYPGHGHREIPNARYDAAFFTKAVEGFLDRLDLREITLVGVSIGGVIPLIIAARRNPRVARVDRHQSVRLRQGARHGAQLSARLAHHVRIVRSRNWRDGEPAQEFRHHEERSFEAASRTPRASPLRSCRRCMPWAIAEGTTAPSSICSATERVGKPQQKTTAASLCPSCSSGATGTGRDLPSASARARSSPVQK